MYCPDSPSVGYGQLAIYAIICSIVSILHGADCFIFLSYSVSRPGVFMLIDHSSGSIGGIPVVCMARCRMVTLSFGFPGTEKSGIYRETGSSRFSFPSAARIAALSAAIDFPIDAIPKIVFPSGVMLRFRSR